MSADVSTGSGPTIERPTIGAPTSSALPLGAPRSFGQASLVLGGAQLGGAYGIANRDGMPTESEIDRLLRLAVAVGVTHIDTARAYGDSEHNIGAALARTGVSTLRVITKIAPLRDGGAEAVSESLRASHDHLSAGGAALIEPPTVLFHRADDALAGGAWATLADLRAEGLADRIGVSVQSPAELLRVISLPDLGYVQLPCNVLDDRWRADAITDALGARPDLVVTVRSVYLQGLLAAGSAVRWPHLGDRDRDALMTTLDQLAADLHREDRADLCVAYVLGLPWVTSVVVGAEHADQLARNAELASRAPLTASERAHVAAALPGVPAALLDPSTWPRP